MSAKEIDIIKSISAMPTADQNRFILEIVKGVQDARNKKLADMEVERSKIAASIIALDESIAKKDQVNG